MSQFNNANKHLIISISSLLIGAGIRVITRKLWTKTKGTPPPDNPAGPGFKRGEALVWTLSLAILSGLGKLLLSEKLTRSMQEGNTLTEDIS